MHKKQLPIAFHARSGKASKKTIRIKAQLD